MKATKQRPKEQEVRILKFLIWAMMIRIETLFQWKMNGEQVDELIIKAAVDLDGLRKELVRWEAK